MSRNYYVCVTVLSGIQLLSSVPTVLFLALGYEILVVKDRDKIAAFADKKFGSMAQNASRRSSVSEQGSLSVSFNSLFFFFVHHLRL
jgi:hypothetical protein